jgi:toluene monooxygenase system ferredoxin subunit
MPFEPACSLDDLWEGEMKEVMVSGASVLLVHAEGGGVAAFSPSCPHQEYPLVKGDLDGRRLTCSAHGWEFDAVTGMGVNPDNCALRSYVVKVENDHVFVDVRAVAPGDAGSRSN